MPETEDEATGDDEAEEGSESVADEKPAEVTAEAAEPDSTVEEPDSTAQEEPAAQDEAAETTEPEATNGKLRNRSYETADGSKRYVTEVVARDVQRLDFDKMKGSGGNRAPHPADDFDFQDPGPESESAPEPEDTAGDFDAGAQSTAGYDE